MWAPVALCYDKYAEEICLTGRFKGAIDDMGVWSSLTLPMDRIWVARSSAEMGFFLVFMGSGGLLTIGLFYLLSTFPPAVYTIINRKPVIGWRNTLRIPIIIVAIWEMPSTVRVVCSGLLSFFPFLHDTKKSSIGLFLRLSVPLALKTKCPRKTKSNKRRSFPLFDHHPSQIAFAVVFFTKVGRAYLSPWAPPLRHLAAHD
jgi:hypothetical protein